ncbi:MAG TPA: FCD domain-containing protein [Pirellulales bacterium]|nr:FCD domain-containing protein [Pirellulales bacterium]
MTEPMTAEEIAPAEVVRLLGNLIAGNRLGPGDRLPPIRELATIFGVKAGTVRDGLLTAQAKGLVKVLPRVGAIVQADEDSKDLASAVTRSFEEVVEQPDQNLFHVLETREALELTMVAKAAQRREMSELYRLRRILTDMAEISFTDESPEYARLDVEFHLEIGRLSGNTVMTSLLKTLLLEVRPHLNRIRWSDNRRAVTNEQHARIYSALVAGDAEQAQRVLRDHIRAAYNSLLDEMRQPPAMNGTSPEGGTTR